MSGDYNCDCQRCKDYQGLAPDDLIKQLIDAGRDDDASIVMNFVTRIMRNMVKDSDRQHILKLWDSVGAVRSEAA